MALCPISTMPSHVAFCAIGVPALDSLHALPVGHVTEFVGAPQTGKTQLCLYAACAAALGGFQVAFFDTCNSLAVERLAEVMRLLGGDVQALGRIRVVKVFDAPTFLASLDSLFAPPDARLRLVVLDSAVALLQPLGGGPGDSLGSAVAGWVSSLASHARARLTRAPRTHARAATLCWHCGMRLCTSKWQCC
jgi:RecA/RadA recombinase